MSTLNVYRFEDDNGRSAFGDYYMGGLPGPTTPYLFGPTTVTDNTLSDAWDIIHNHHPEGLYYNASHGPRFAFVDLKQARKYMDVDSALAHGKLKQVTVRLGSVILCETQAIYDEYGVEGIETVTEES